MIQHISVHFVRNVIYFEQGYNVVVAKLILLMVVFSYCYCIFIVFLLHQALSYIFLLHSSWTLPYLISCFLHAQIQLLYFKILNPMIKSAKKINVIHRI